MATTRLVLDDGGGWRELARPEGVDGLLHEPATRFWLDICDPGPAEVELLRRELALHELALEHVERRHQRTRCVPFDGYAFLVVYAAEHAADGMLPRELQLFWGRNYLVTIHHGPLAALDEARRRWQRADQLAPGSVDVLVYVLFDSLVDSHFALQDWIGDRIEATEEAILAGDQAVSGEIFRLRKQLVAVRRLIAPTGDMLAEALRRRPPLPEALHPYFDDLQDHCAHVLAELDTYGALLAAALDIHVEAWFGRLGEIMKRLTAITVVVMVPNLVAGIYGMNLGGLFPPPDWEWGFPVMVGLIAAMIIWGFIHSKLLGWL